MINRRKITKSIAYAILLCFTSLTGAQPLYAIPANTQLPVVDDTFTPIGGVTIPELSGITNNTMNITQTENTSVIKWKDFSIGADAKVIFEGPKVQGGFNSLNYVANGGPISEIYGQLTALGGNIFIANPAGVQIGNSAQINVGSLYVTNKSFTDDELKNMTNRAAIDNALAQKAAGAAELMSLGAIVDATKVTFDGGRIVLDTDRIYQTDAETGEPTQVNDEALKGILNIRTTDANEVVLGYTAYDKTNGYNSAEKRRLDVTLTDGSTQAVDGYMWVEDLDQLQAMKDTPSGWYALRNSIDANATADGEGFTPIGKYESGKDFTGRFDGLGYSIFGLTIKASDDNDVGLFGHTSDAYIRNFTLNGGSVNGGDKVGAAVGNARGGIIENITNTMNVSGTEEVGGIVGTAQDVTMSGLINIGSVSGTDASIGGVVGYMYDGSLTGETYNLGHVSGGHEVGGIVGSAVSSTIGNEVTKDNPDAFQIYNQLDVDGNYNVGGIVGSITGGSITNAANHGDIIANGSTSEFYQYHRGNAVWIDNVLYIFKNDLATGSAVRIANAGGIAGNTLNSSIFDVTNTGDVTTSTTDGNAAIGTYYYNAGNVGGIVGRAENTKIENAENKENTVAGAHNVGGIAGFLTGDGTVDTGVDNSVNNGGDITATGARTDSGFAKEHVRGSTEGGEDFHIGNIGGIVGYLFGDYAYVKNSGNRGTVHSAEITGDTIPETAKAANVGGVVGKISSETIGTEDILQEIKDGERTATVSNSYNTGDVRGYTGVGGIVGQMFNGSVSGSYNLGTLEATRTVAADSMAKESLNMGGIVGDTSEESEALSILYNVYNSGQIGDEDFYFRGRHVGGIVGRLSGYVDKAYNTGEIYNGYSTVGGIAGWWFDGKISNVFNTGNITVRNYDAENKRSQVGGIVGDAGQYAESLYYAYNLGTIRSFAPYAIAYDEYGNAYNAYSHHVGGIAGRITDNLKIDNVYTLGNLYAASQSYNSTDYTSTSDTLGAIYGSGGNPTKGNITNANYITPDNPGTGDNKFIDLSASAEGQGINVVEYDYRDDAAQYKLVDPETGADDIAKLTGRDWTVNRNQAWRLYENGTPILNVFTPNAEEYFSKNNDGINSIQYGTAYNPLLVILNTDENSTLNLDWKNVDISGAGGLAVYGGGLKITDFASAGDGRYFGGTIFSEGELSLSGTGTNFNLGSASKLYGSSVKLNANGGDISAYGEVTSTNGNIEVSGKNVEIIGSLTAKADGETTEIDGISSASKGTMNTTGLNDPTKAMKSVSEMFTHTTGEAETNGDITVNASGAAEVLYGNLGTGSVSTAGNFTVNGGTTDGGSVYVDSDLSGTTGNINLSAGGEVLLDITNIAKANSNEQGYNGKNELHKFLVNYKEGGDNKITLDSANDDEIIAIDMWGDGTDTGSFALDKYNLGDGQTLRDAFDNLNIGNGLSAEDIVHIWISDAEQLNGIQSYYDDKQGKTNILNYNFALKGNIDASELEGYKAIGGDKAYSGTFDGRDFRIIGLNADATKADEASSGIFGKLAGTVKDLRVYASKFFGGANENAGVIAAEVADNGTITGVTTFGNIVTAEDGAAGGIAGENSGSILESTASDSVTASGENAYAGGVAGVNTGSIGEEGEAGESAQITADSAVRSGANGAAAIGGVVGKNETDGEVWLANSLGVTTGANAESTGGIAGTNSGTMTSLYNESIVTGGSSVGGVAGDNSGTMTNAVNATGVTGTVTNTGGLIGNNSGTVDSGRNAGTINGKDYVGGMVGSNGEKGILKNLSNAIVAAITGKNYVGGIAGSNAGSITSDNNLTNEGTVSGTQYVGGIAGENKGKIENVLNETLVLKTGDGADAKYFGGIAGTNSGTITNATNNSNVSAVGADGADGAEYVGGIVGQNTNTGTLVGELTNKGNVSGEDKVGGLAGENNNPALLQGTEDENGETIRLVVTNAGKVSASGGSAGGIFYKNTGNIINADLTNKNEVVGKGNNATGGLFGTNSGKITNSTLTNTGTVTGNGVTGGLFGENFGAVTGGSKLTNSGTVKGGDNTGGLIGKNSGDVSFSSLINEYGAEVTGGDNTGGLIGYNTGTIKGGRNDADGKDLGLYSYKIYNNGTVIGGNNTGGLIGTNDTNGMLYAAYNTGTVTGAVYKDDGTVDHYTNNVGGIVGTNYGTVSSVFNTIMTATGENQSVTGASNVGGLIGSNIGTLKDAYNTTAVETTSNGETKGNAVGKNSGTVGNVYATNTDGKLIGNNTNDKVSNVYSFSTGDMSAKVIDTEEDRKQSISYNDFAFGSTWKNYDGWSLPMLSVFLTKATYTDKSDLTYSATNQSATGSFTAADGLIANISTGGQLLLNTENKNANSYLAYYSGQIAASGTGEGFDPNNLGYDIDNNSYTIKKAQLDMVLNDINRTYGDATMYDSDGKQTNYGFTFGDNGTVLNDAMREELKDIKFTQETDGAVDGVDKSREQKTNNAGTYKWTADFALGNLADNYEFIGEGAGDDGTTFSGSGKSEVRRADLTVTLDNVERIYGDLDILNGVYQIKDANLVNGDSGLKLNYDVVFTDNGLTDDRTRTNDAGEHKWLVGTDALVGVDNLSQNYIINIVPGQSTVKPRELTISDIVAKIVYGDQGSKGWEITGGTLGNIAYNDDVQLSTELTENNAIFSQAYLNDKGNRTTADVGIYKDGISYNLSLKGDKAGNYTIADAVSGTVEVIKAALTFIVGDASTTYGTDFDESKYGYTLSGMANEDSQESLSALIGDVQYENSAAFDDPNGRRTADAGRHKDAISITSGVNLKNYSVAFENGDAVIDKASLTVNANDASAVYGSASWNYGYKLDGLANGDTAEGLSEELSGIKYDNTAAFDGTNGRYTADAGIHEDAISVNLTGVDLKNYEVVAGNKGTAAVTPAKLTITADDQSVLLGTRPEYTGTAPADLGNQLVNGDSLDGFSYIFGVADTGLETEIGRHEGVIGLFTGGHFYGGGTHDLSTLSSVFHNYDVTVDAGTLTVSAGDNFGHLHWLHRGGERVRNFRERKAEIYFHEGGMVHEEAL